MRKITLTDRAERVRRNLVVSSFAVICMLFFEIEIDGIGFSSVNAAFKNANAVLVILSCIIIYESAAFGLLLWEEYQDWALTFYADEHDDWNDVPKLNTLAKQLTEMTALLAQVTINGGIVRNNEDVFSAADASRINSFSKEVETYVKRFANFPNNVKFRFFLLDAGVPFCIATSALIYVTAKYWAPILKWLC